jgi:hypothetical protein
MNQTPPLPQIYDGTRIKKPIKRTLWIKDNNDIFIKKTTCRGASLCYSKNHEAGKRSLSRDVGSQVAIGVAAVTQFNGRNGLIFTKKSQKGSILGRLAKDSFAGPTYNVASSFIP